MFWFLLGSRYGRRPNPTADCNPNPNPKPQPKRGKTRHNKHGCAPFASNREISQLRTTIPKCRPRDTFFKSKTSLYIPSPRLLNLLLLILEKYIRAQTPRNLRQDECIRPKKQDCKIYGLIHRLLRPLLITTEYPTDSIISTRMNKNYSQAVSMNHTGNAPPVCVHCCCLIIRH